MVEKWKKKLKKTSRNFWKKDLDKIVEDIIDDNYFKYDYKPLSWYKNLVRIRVWKYRIVFRQVEWDNQIILFWKRWDVYKSLKNLSL